MESAAKPVAGRPVALYALLMSLTVLCVALAVWQVQRLQWKEALIARVEAGMRASPLPVKRLPASDLVSLEYRRVSLNGRYDAQGTVLVAGASTRGSGYWVLTPVSGAARTVYVNRGFVPLGSKLLDVRQDTPTGPVFITGLLRRTEPGGGFLRANRPTENRWYSRDVAQIAVSKSVSADPRLFIDAITEAPSSPSAPIPGLTIINFPNNHLAYALTWAALSILSAGAAIMLWRRPA
ncbi:SURF1 family protein [Novosphingobium sp. ERN07]|nr:SURF1 family protein [Novosphingobium sp. ERN07]